MVDTSSSNCFGFVHAGLNDSDQDFYLDRDSLELPCLTSKKQKIAENSTETASEILDTLQSSKDRSGWKVLELFDREKRSQHVAFLDSGGNFYDQKGPDGEIRLRKNLETLLDEYKELFGNAYYQVHYLNLKQSNNVEAFIGTYKDYIR